jgi:hypothetical protein
VTAVSGDISEEMAAAVGWVAIEAATLEAFLAEVVGAARGWEPAQIRAALGAPGQVRKQLRALARDRPGDRALQQIVGAAEDRLDDRHVVLHSVSITIFDEDGERSGFWHPKSDQEPDITLGTLREQAFETRRVRRAAQQWLIDHGGP